MVMCEFTLSITQGHVSVVGTRWINLRTNETYSNPGDIPVGTWVAMQARLSADPIPLGRTYTRDSNWSGTLSTTTAFNSGNYSEDSGGSFAYDLQSGISMDWVSLDTLTVSATSKPILTKVPGFSYINGTCTSVTDNAEFTTLDECTAAHPTSTTGKHQPPPTWDGNPLTLGKYIGDMVGWLGNELQADISDLTSSIWSGLQTVWNLIFTGWTNFWAAFTSFWLNPVQWFTTLITGLFKTDSPSLLTDFLDWIWNSIHYFSNKYGGKYPPADPSKSDIVTEVQNLGAQVGSEIATPVTESSVTNVITDLDSKVSAVFTSLFALQAVAEEIPTIDRSGTANFALSWLEARGIFAVMRGVLGPYLDANLNRMQTYHLNKDYHNVLPGIGDLERLRNIGDLPAASFSDWGSQITGINPATLDLIRVGHHETPNLMDAITYARRYAQPLDLAGMQDLLGINYSTDWAKYFNERQYSDPSIRAMVTLSKLGKLTDGDYDSFLNRQGYRKDMLPGQTISDFDLMKSYLKESMEPSVLKSLVASQLKTYLAGQTTLDELSAVASRLYKDPTELADYLATAQNDKTAKIGKLKHFTYSQLIKFAESGIDVTQFMDADLKAEGFDDSHRVAVEAYIGAVLKSKGLTLSGTPIS